MASVANCKFEPREVQILFSKTREAGYTSLKFSGAMCDRFIMQEIDRRKTFLLPAVIGIIPIPLGASSQSSRDGLEPVATAGDHYRRTEVLLGVNWRSIFGILRFLWVLAFSFIPFACFAQDSPPATVALKLNLETCSGSEGNLLPMPEDNEFVKNMGEDALLSWDRPKWVEVRLKDIYGDGCKLDGIALAGRITQDTFEIFTDAQEVLSSMRIDSTVGGYTLWLDSPGGLISEAIKIGDAVARNRMEAIVAFNGGCYSSCVLIFAAARTRSGIGDVGVHRPFSDEISVKDITYAEYLEQYEDIELIMKEYLGKYGVSPSLVDAMNVVPSDDIRVLSYVELEEFGLGYVNVAAEEYEKAMTRQICGREFYDLQQSWRNLIDQCDKNLGKSGDFIPACFDLANQTFPDFQQRSEECNELKESARP